MILNWANQPVQRTGASQVALRPVVRPPRVAPVADLTSLAERGVLRQSCPTLRDTASPEMGSEEIR